MGFQSWKQLYLIAFADLFLWRQIAHSLSNECCLESDTLKARSISSFLEFKTRVDRPVLKELHWLPIEQRITFKVLLLTFKALNNLTPPYLSQLIVPYNPLRNLRSAGKHLLEVPNVRLKSYGSRAFSVAAPKHWNDIPLDIKLSRSVDVFKSRLKTYLFRLAFN